MPAVKRPAPTPAARDADSKKQSTLTSLFKPQPKAANSPVNNVNSANKRQPTCNSAVCPPTKASPVPLDSVTVRDLIAMANVDDSWSAVFNKELSKPYIRQLETFLQAEYKAHPSRIFPPANRIFAWAACCPLPSVRVVILGQDPYHDDGQAMGLCFSVPVGIRIPPSLLNIYKELERDIVGFKMPSHGQLDRWANQGVCLLNTSLTVRAHEAASHSGRGWETFTDAVVSAVSKEAPAGIVFMLWGAHAQKRLPMIDKKRHLILQAPHPSPLSASRGFFGCGHFSKANAYLASKGQQPIDWQV